jgi:hypothetical protein
VSYRRRQETMRLNVLSMSNMAAQSLCQSTGELAMLRGGQTRRLKCILMRPKGHGTPSPFPAVITKARKYNLECCRPLVRLRIRDHPRNRTRTLGQLSFRTIRPFRLGLYLTQHPQ